MTYISQIAQAVDGGDSHLEDLFGLMEYPEIEIEYAHLVNVEEKEKLESILAFIRKYEFMVSIHLISKALTSSLLSVDMRCYLYGLFVQKRYQE